jgi:hypothetical protein
MPGCAPEMHHERGRRFDEIRSNQEREGVYLVVLRYATLKGREFSGLSLPRKDFRKVLCHLANVLTERTRNIWNQYAKNSIRP